MGVSVEALRSTHAGLGTPSSAAGGTAGGAEAAFTCQAGEAMQAIFCGHGRELRWHAEDPQTPPSSELRARCR